MENMSFISIPKDWTNQKRITFENAIKLFGLYGYANVTLVDIAKGNRKQCDDFGSSVHPVPKPTVAAYFKKEELLKEIFDLCWESIDEKVIEILEKKTTTTQKVRYALESIPRLLEQDLDAAAVIIRERYPYGDNEKGYKGEVYKGETVLKKFRTELENSNESNLKIEKSEIDFALHCFLGAIEQGMLKIYFQYVSKGSNRIEKIVKAHESVGNLIEVLNKMADGFLGEIGNNEKI